jgi:hypothetical protein
MSYLNPLRLHFAGKFQANVSTVNNDPGHFDNATFQPSYQEMQAPDFNPPNGWFNPAGDAAFRLLGCRVTSAWMADGQPATHTDGIVHYLVADSDSQVCAKLVDLDSEQQLVSTIWGLQVRITDAAGNTLLRGDFEPAAFADIWDRATGSGGGGDIGAGAMYQSILTNLKWGDLSSSAFLQTLQASAQTDGLLSIKFNVDGLNMSFKSPDFMCGRIAGTIGPASVVEPHQMVLGRHFMAKAAAGGNFFKPAGGINFFAGCVDEKTSSIFLDLGNALTTSSPGGSPNNVGDLTLGAYNPIATPGNPAGTVLPLGTISAHGTNGYASDPKWYSRTAGIVVLSLTGPQLALVESASLVLSSANGSMIAEWTSGAFVRADQFVFRMSPGDRVEIAVFATQWGRPLVGANVSFVADPSQLQPSNMINPNDIPPVATPSSALSFNGSAITDKTGKAILEVEASDPQNPRGFIDGQVYGIRPGLTDAQYTTGPVNQWDFVSFLVWDAFTPAEPITWSGCLEPVFQQYANLYPVMLRFLDLSSYEQVCANVRLLQLAFALDPSNPNSMPVTRDLSPAKRQAILKWLANPVRGAPPRKPAVAVAAPEAAIDAGNGQAAVPMLGRGGKAEAAARRLVLTRQSNHPPNY